MIFDGIKLVEGSELQNLTVNKGPSLPSSAQVGELFYLIGNPNAFHIYSGDEWVKIEDAKNKIQYTPVNRAGDKMSGYLELHANPVLPLQAATKQYVDDRKVPWTNIDNKPTTLAGFGLTDAQAKDADLTAIANLTTPGLLSRTGNGTAATRQINGVSGRIAVTNGNGVNGNPSIDLATVGVAGTYALVTTDEFGRVLSGANEIQWSSIDGKPTTIAGYGINDAQPLSADLTSIANLIGQGVLMRGNNNTWAFSTGVAMLNSPNFTGVPTAPTAAQGSNSTQIANAAFVSAAIQAAAAAFQGGSVASAAKWTTARTIALSGDGSASLVVDGSNNVTSDFTLATINSTPGSYGSASAIPSVTVNGKGLVTAVATTPIAINASQVTAGSFPDARISSSNVTQHQASLVISETQLSDGNVLPRITGNETITGEWSFTKPIAGSEPITGAHLATKQYVDNMASGLDPKASVKVATTANITLSSLQTIDGVALTAGDRVLVKNQTNQTQNGIYNANAGTWSRAADADNSPGVEVSTGMYCFVESGNVNKNSGWQLTTEGPITLGTSNLTFVQFTGLGQIEAGNGLVKSGTNLAVQAVSSARIAVSVNGVDLATVSNSGSGSFNKVAVDGYGRVTGTTAVTSSDLTSILNSVYQPLDGDLTSIASLSGTAGILKKTAANTWILDTTDYNSGGNQSINITGDASGSGSSAITLTFATVNNNVGTFGSASSIPVLTVNGKGLVTGVSSQSLITSNIAEGSNLYYTDARARAAISVGGVGLSINNGVVSSNATPNATANTIVSRDASGNFAANVITASLTGNVSGTASNVTGVVAVTNGGTGATTAALALTNLGAMPASNPVSTGISRKSVGTVAATGTTQATATVVTTDMTLVNSGTGGVTLPSNVVGAQLVVINATANSINVYPQTGGTIDSSATNVALSIPAGSRLMFLAVSSLKYHTLNATYA